MDSFELNKIIGAILGTLLFVMGVGFLAEGIYHPITGAGPGYELPEPEGTAAAAEAPTDKPAVSIGTLLASANPEDGKAAARKCQSCHNFVSGGPNGQGPNLYGVVGRPVASHEGFSYSDAMKQHATDVGDWSYDALNVFLTAPKAAVPGTKMNFAGVKDDTERANIIAFLSTLSDAPVPFPAADAAAPADAPAAAPAGETPAAAPADAPAAAPAAEAPAAAPAAETPATDTPTTTQSETPVEGTATQTNVPAGETPAPAPATP